jgi:hypothetical protein
MRIRPTNIDSFYIYYTTLTSRGEVDKKVQLESAHDHLDLQNNTGLPSFRRITVN